MTQANRDSGLVGDSWPISFENPQTDLPALVPQSAPVRFTGPVGASNLVPGAMANPYIWRMPSSDGFQPGRAPNQVVPNNPAKLSRAPVVLIMALVLAVTLGFATLLQPKQEASPITPQTSQAPARNTPTGPATEPTADPSVGIVPTHDVPVTEELSRGIVFIVGDTSGGLSTGTGVIRREDGVVTTNYHVVQGTTSLTVVVVDTGERYSAEMVGHDQWDDIAVLRVHGAGGLTPAAIRSTPVTVGEKVTSVGNARGGGVLYGSSGSVIAVNQDAPRKSHFGGQGVDVIDGMMLMSTGAVPGYSGGPTFDESNQVIGMTTAASPDAPATDMRTFAIPVTHVTDVMNQILAGDEKGHVRVGPRSWLGISLTDADNAIVADVATGSPADRAGITAGETITEFDGKPIETNRMLLELIAQRDPGETVTMKTKTVMGNTNSYEISLGESPTN